MAVRRYKWTSSTSPEHSEHELNQITRDQIRKIELANS